MHSYSLDNLLVSVYINLSNRTSVLSAVETTMRGFIQVLRVYSLVDLALLMYVLEASERQLIGVLCLWVSFLLLLEWGHQHQYRPTVRTWSWIALGTLGLVLLPKLESVGFLLLGYLYTKKDCGYWAAIAPLIRGLQTVVLILAISASLQLGLLAGVAITVRNLLGDVRDAGKDRTEGMKTIPVLLGLRRNVRHVHLVATYGTTAFWAFGFGDVSWWTVAGIWGVQSVTYHLTPR